MHATLRRPHTRPTAVTRPTGVSPERHAPRPGSRRAMLELALAYIEEHLEDGSLTPDRVAAGIFVSKRHLYMLFQDAPRSVSRHIIGRRLQVIAERLVDPEHAHLSAAEIAMRVGFKEASHFARAFKAEFGVTPGRYRSERRAALRAA